MPRLHLLAALCLGCLLALPSVAQPLHIRLYAGWETYGHQDLKEVQQELRLVLDQEDQLYQDAQIANAPGFQGEMLLGLGRFRVGLAVGYSATRARLQYRDVFNGPGAADAFRDAFHDQKLDLLWAGMTVESRVLAGLPVWGMLQVRLSDTALIWKSHSGAGSVSSFHKLEATGLSLVPGVALEGQLGALVTRLVLGFEYSLARGGWKDRITHRLFQEDQPTALRATWTGLRFGLSLGWIAADR